MREAEARAHIERACAASAEPVLTEDEVAALVRRAKRIDRYGVRPNEAGWTETFHLAPACAEGWRWKAAKAAGNYAFSADGASFNREQVYAHCVQQAALYQAQAGVSSLLVTQTMYPDGWDYAEQIGNL